MKIVFISKYSPPSYSGAGRAVLRLARKLQSLGDCETVLLTARLDRGLAKRDNYEGVEVIRLPVSALTTLASELTFYLSCAGWLLTHPKEYDLIQFANLPRMWLPVLLVAKVLRKPIFLRTTSYGTDDLRTVSSSRLGRVRLLLYSLTKGIITISKSIDEVSRSATKRFGLLWYIPNFVDPNVFRPVRDGAEKAELRAKLGLPEVEPIALFCGSVIARKGIDLLIEAWPEVVRRLPDALLCVLGPQIFGDRFGVTNEDFIVGLRERIEELGLVDSVRFLGPKSDEIPDYYRAASVFVLPSRQEGMPNAVLEAMSTGIPVVVCLEPWLPDGFIKNGENGVIAEPSARELAAAICEVLNDPKLAAKMGEKGREKTFREHHPDRVARSVLSLYANHVDGVSNALRAVTPDVRRFPSVSRRGRPVLLATQSFPPSTSGSSVILFNLLRHFDENSIVAVHGLNNPLSPSLDLMLPFHRYRAPAFDNARFVLALARRIPSFVTELVRRRILTVARFHRVRRIYAHYPSAVFVVAAWKAAKRLGLPLAVYFDILWEESVSGVSAGFARRFEHDVVQYADRRFAITEYAAAHLAQKHGVAFDVIPHTACMEDVAPGLQSDHNGRPVVHLAGGVYSSMNQDAVERLVAASDCCESRPLLSFLTPSIPADLHHQNVEIGFLGRDELRTHQRHSTILYCPQAFQSQNPLMIKNNFPTKMMEYLCAGRPILIHSPPDSYLSMLAKREGFAVVVDQPDVAALAAAIDRLVVDSDLQERVVSRAFDFVNKRASFDWAGVLWNRLQD